MGVIYRTAIFDNDTLTATAGTNYISVSVPKSQSLLLAANASNATNSCEIDIELIVGGTSVPIAQRVVAASENLIVTMPLGEIILNEAFAVRATFSGAIASDSLRLDIAFLEECSYA